MKNLAKPSLALAFAVLVLYSPYIQAQSPQMVVGTATNPLIKGDVPDVSVIRMGDAYYMVSTTMYFMPVAPIMKSYDLVNWKIVSYCGDIIDDAANFRLETENNDLIGDYGRGQWAASIRYFKNRFWVIFKNNTTNKSYRYSTADPDNGPWDRVVLNRGFHDPSIFYDEDTDKTYIFQGYNNITVTEMTNDLTAVKQGGIDKTIINGSDGLEGSQAYKANGYYYLFLINWKPTKRAVHCYRSTKIEGPYEEKLVLDYAFSGGGGVAQGGIVNTPDGDWYGVFFQDRGAVGRVPFLVPMTWSSDKWPVFGANQTNTVGTVPASFQIKLAQGYETNLYYSDEFCYNSNKPHLAWQWNHNPDNANWSFTERPGFLRLKTGRTSKTIYHARNTLTQRTREPSSTAEIALETTNMKDGDVAGLVVLQALSGFVGIEQSGTQKNIVMYTGDNGDSHKGQNAIVERKASVAFTGNKIFLRAVCEFSNNKSTATFYYRTSEQQQWQSIGTTVNLQFILTHFTGARFGLFNYATKTAGGYVDFDYFKTNASNNNSSCDVSPPNNITVTCNVNNLDSSYISGSSVPRPNVNCSTGEPGTAKFSIGTSPIDGWDSPGGTHELYNTGTRNVTLSKVECGSDEVTLNPAISCGSFEIAESTTPVVKHSPLAASHSPKYYSLKGEPLGNAKPQKAGIYIVKEGYSVKKIVVR